MSPSLNSRGRPGCSPVSVKLPLQYSQTQLILRFPGQFQQISHRHFAATIVLLQEPKKRWELRLKIRHFVKPVDGEENLCQPLVGRLQLCLATARSAGVSFALVRPEALRFENE